MWLLLNKVEILDVQNAPFGRLQCPSAILNFTPIIFFSTLRIFCQDGHFWGEEGGGFCISFVGKQPVWACWWYSGLRRATNIYIDRSKWSFTFGFQQLESWIQLFQGVIIKITPNSLVRRENERGRWKGIMEEGGADYGGMVQPSQQHVWPYKNVGWVGVEVPKIQHIKKLEPLLITFSLWSIGTTFFHSRILNNKKQTSRTRSLFPFVFRQKWSRRIKNDYICPVGPTQ